MTKCPSCGAPARGKFCEYCGTEIATGASAGVTVNVNFGSQVLPQNAGASIPQGYTVNTGAAADPGYAAGYAAGHAAAQRTYSASNYTPTSPKNWLVALLLCIFLGEIGAHWFYVGRWGWGLVYLFTFGFLGIGWVIDIIRILMGRLEDSNGLRVTTASL